MIMKANRIQVVVGALLAGGLLTGFAAAQAATGYNITDRQEAMIHPGMTTAQVRQELGTPDAKLQYPNKAGPVWSYNDPDSLQPGVFLVRFTPNGNKVASAQEIPFAGS
jgi:hypothetical protein